MDEGKTVTAIENVLNVMADVSVQNERINGWIPSSATNVIMNWPERIKTQPHDDRDNCFLPFDSKKGSCGMTVNNIDDDSATKHGDSHTNHGPNALPPSPAADPSSDRSTFKHLLVLHLRCNMFEPSFLRHFSHNTPLTAFLTISAVSFTYSLLHPQASRLDMSCTRKALPGR